MSHKKKVLFIGSFKSKSSTGHVGGQMFACNSLLDSALKHQVKWLPLDTTASTNKNRSFYVRAFGAAKRIAKFTFHLLFSKVDTVLIFTSHGWGFREKGFLLRLASFFGKKTIIAPRSGHLIQDITSSPTFHAFANKVFSQADYILCQGTFWKTFFENQFDLDDQKLKILHNWIDLSGTPRNNKAVKPWMSTSYCPPLEGVGGGISPKNLNILYLGWIDQKKGIFDLMEAAKQITDPSILFVIGGKGNDEAALIEMIQTTNLKDKVHLAGWVLGEDKNKLLQEADVLVLPSYAEGSPNVILEAMKYGIPVISTKVGAIPDIIEHKKNGLLMEPGDINALKKHILTLCNDEELRKKYAQASYQKLQQQHDIKVAVHLLSKILK